MTKALRWAGAGVAATVLGTLAAAPATAHVSVSAPEAAPGGFTKLAFRVPNEKNDQATTQVEVVFPAGSPMASVSVRPSAGWTYDVTKETLPQPLELHGSSVKQAVRRVVWKASGAGIKPGEFEEFEVSAGPLPEAGTLTFQALQTYSGGEVIRWIQTSTDGGEAERPAPVLQLTASGGNADDGPGPWEIAALGLAGLAVLTGLTALLTSARRRPAP